MKIQIRSFDYLSRIPAAHAFGVPAAGQMAFGPNRSPEIAWSDTPANVRSFALIMHDPDVPSPGAPVNLPGSTVSSDHPRVDFYHMVLIDIPPQLRRLEEALDSDGVVKGGKSLGKRPYGVRGYNDFTGWFESDPEMAGDYGGYDGPCPPWNDEIIHHYHFTIYALDVPSLGLGARFGGPETVRAMDGHILDFDSWIGTYTLNPALL